MVHTGSFVRSRSDWAGRGGRVEKVIAELVWLSAGPNVYSGMNHHTLSTSRDTDYANQADRSRTTLF